MQLKPKPIKSSVKQVIAFFDGQNLFKRINEAFGYNLQFPNYDPLKLAEEICKTQDQWELKQVRFYTGIFQHKDNPKLHKMWTDKLNITHRKASNMKGNNFFYKFTAYPKDPNFPIKHLNKTMPIPFDKTLYEQCIDPRNYN